jgi:uncharacterized protein YbjT (DUF2867 family)
VLKHGDNPLFNAKQAVENHLRKSRLSFTMILRPTFFMVWLSPHSSFDFVTIYGSGENKVSYIRCTTSRISP